MALKVKILAALLAVCFMVMLAGTAAVQTARAGDFETEGAAQDIITSVPRTMTYQGIMEDNTGEPLNGVASVTFAVFDVESGGTSLWSEVVDVEFTDGLFTAMLGLGVPLNLSFDADYYLEIGIGGETLSPRQKITMSAYAAVADTADYAWNVSDGISNWTVTDSVLYTNNYWGIARGGADNKLWGDKAHTMVNLGVACTTGLSTFYFEYNTVGGGQYNRAMQSYSTVSGGYRNEAYNLFSTVSGGCENIAYWTYATVGGGQSNEANNGFATVPGGKNNTAAGQYSFAAGRRAKANHNGTFVWGDDTSSDFESTGDNQFLIRASGGVGIGTNSPDAELDVNGTIKSSSGGFEFPDGTTMTTAAIGAPVGGVIAWLKTYPNTPSLPPEYVECNGQALNDPDSPYHQYIIPNLNAGSRFLRGGTSSGGTGGSVNHTHDVNVDDWSYVTLVNPTHTVANTGIYTSDNRSHLPPYYRVVWVMRIK